jgi:drug/metabolite transporter (DMT)-like permease
LWLTQIGFWDSLNREVPPVKTQNLKVFGVTVGQYFLGCLLALGGATCSTISIYLIRKNSKAYIQLTLGQSVTPQHNYYFFCISSGIFSVLYAMFVEESGISLAFPSWSQVLVDLAVCVLGLCLQCIISVINLNSKGRPP